MAKLKVVPYMDLAQWRRDLATIQRDITRLSALLGGLPPGRIRIDDSSIISSTRSVNTLRDALRGLSGGVVPTFDVGQLPGQVRNLTRVITEYAVAADRAHTVSDIFRGTMGRLGQDTGGASALVDRLTGSLNVNRITAQNAVTEMIRLGGNIRDIEGILRGATASSLKLGRSTGDAFDGIINVLATQNSRYLNQIGIAENLVDFRQKVGNELGKRPGDLTNAENFEALKRLVDRATVQEVKDLDRLLASIPGQLDRMKVAAEYAKQAIGEQFRAPVANVARELTGLLTVISKTDPAILRAIGTFVLLAPVLIKTGAAVTALAARNALLTTSINATTVAALRFITEVKLAAFFGSVSSSVTAAGGALAFFRGITFTSVAALGALAGGLALVTAALVTGINAYGNYTKAAQEAELAAIGVNDAVTKSLRQDGGDAYAAAAVRAINTSQALIELQRQLQAAREAGDSAEIARLTRSLAAGRARIQSLRDEAKAAKDLYRSQAAILDITNQLGGFQQDLDVFGKTDIGKSLSDIQKRYDALQSQAKAQIFSETEKNKKLAEIEAQRLQATQQAEAEGRRKITEETRKAAVDAAKARYDAMADGSEKVLGLGELEIQEVKRQARLQAVEYAYYPEEVERLNRETNARVLAMRAKLAVEAAKADSDAAKARREALKAVFEAEAAAIQAVSDLRLQAAERARDRDLKGAQDSALKRLAVEQSYAQRVQQLQVDQKAGELADQQSKAREKLATDLANPNLDAAARERLNIAYRQSLVAMTAQFNSDVAQIATETVQRVNDAIRAAAEDSLSKADALVTRGVAQMDRALRLQVGQGEVARLEAERVALLQRQAEYLSAQVDDARRLGLSEAQVNELTDKRLEVQAQIIELARSQRTESIAGLTAERALAQERLQTSLEQATTYQEQARDRAALLAFLRGELGVQDARVKALRDQQAPTQAILDAERARDGVAKDLAGAVRDEVDSRKALLQITRDIASANRDLVAAQRSVLGGAEETAFNRYTAAADKLKTSTGELATVVGSDFSRIRNLTADQLGQVPGLINTVTSNIRETQTALKGLRTEWQSQADAVDALARKLDQFQSTVEDPANIASLRDAASQRVLDSATAARTAASSGNVEAFAKSFETFTSSLDALDAADKRVSDGVKRRNEERISALQNEQDVLTRGLSGAAKKAIDDDYTSQLDALRDANKRLDTEDAKRAQTRRTQYQDIVAQGRALVDTKTAALDADKQSIDAQDELFRKFQGTIPNLGDTVLNALTGAFTAAQKDGSALGQQVGGATRDALVAAIQSDAVLSASEAAGVRLADGFARQLATQLSTLNLGRIASPGQIAPGGVNTSTTINQQVTISVDSKRLKLSDIPNREVAQKLREVCDYMGTDAALSKKAGG